MDNSKKTQDHHIVQDATDTLSLSDVNGSIEAPKDGSFWRKLLAFSGPGALVAVGYMDPGNWVTSVGGGAQYHYVMLSIVLISSLVAMMLQYMAGKLGIVRQEDLAQATRDRTNKPGGIALWIMTELALMATDIAEVIGGAIALHLLFGWSMIASVLTTAFDVVLLLILMKFGFRKIEAIVMTLIITILVIFGYLVILSNPNLVDLFGGYLPQLQAVSTHGPKGVDSPLLMSLGIIGATVMPHNLYLHSSISQTRKVDRKDKGAVKEAVRFMTWDSNIQLSLAFVINSFLLILGASLFFGQADSVGTFGDMYNALGNTSIAGAIASPVLSTLFAVALLASGQNSTITGTLTGEIIMEGFLHMRIPMWLRRVVTRGLALIPVIGFTLYYGGQEGELDKLLLNSQVFLSVALPFAMAPLIMFTSSKKIMGEFVNPKWMIILGWLTFIVLTGLNIKLIVDMVTGWLG
ncbi:Nramp family divalent metal transporter [Leuconostoc gelidum]|uniref:Divalent metal cation transporter MntH n=1 Tax=Leuconostoc gelidum subsp. gelidum TaxID=1607839 RepID=A0AB35FXP4_LEUGE|nr:Nramp family divalent metal transporter [Leuconostoc gelidum]AFS41002.1 Mn2+/Fe2+ transporter, NRAMP family protein [Leuconostoc gelidum JB7]MBZ5964227.1 Nramp family divalent metal transporter [Leuconostoc gelidum subsp. gelidum]MBZ5975732.1 Nramp family divalent metal transporter [Leuconostoc gelidum subsp. gelidum]MBZ5976789.1 Nramp family divalent metal transporter [Leuconostoc gelidum subsp. gelidum]MBZ5986043.1 Nramp family divalent metal transporter [Leuconostoc gelidum subsp. gelidu